MDRRSFLAKGIELASAAPLIYLLGENFESSRRYHEANIERALVDEKPNVLKEFDDIQKGYNLSLENLANEYRSEYYRSHIETYTTTDGEGYTHFHTKTVWEWEEPRNIPKHREIYSWRDQQINLLDKTDLLLSQPIIDVRSKIDNVKIEEREANKLGQGILSTMVYGSGICGLLFYEEALDIPCTPNQVSRRSFFKVGAALSGAFAAGKVKGYNERNLEQGKRELTDSVLNAYTQKDLEPSLSFERYFGETPEGITSRVQEVIEISKETLSNEIRKKDIIEGFNGVVETGNLYLDKLKTFFENGVPEELGRMTTYKMITDNITRLSKSQGSNAVSSVLLEGLAVGGTLAAIIVPLEILNQKVG